MENKLLPEETNNKKEESIFTEEDFSLQNYDKHIRQARNAIFAAAIILAFNISVLIFTIPENYAYLWLDILIYGGFVAGFIILGLWTKRKPYYAIVGALILYGSFIVLNAALDVKTLFSGIILKIIIIVILVKGINDAKEAQERKEILTRI